MMMRRRMLLAALLGSGGGLFPAYLTIGDNGQLGIDVWQYLENRRINEGTGVITLTSSEKLYLNGTMVTRVAGTVYKTLIPVNYVLLPNGSILEY